MSEASPRTRPALEQVLLLAVFFVVVAATLVRHEMWLDELNSWLIARDAHNLRGLFANMHGESHPVLWYLCLYPLTRFTTDPRAMQGMHLIIASCTVAVIAWASPFSTFERWLLAFSYLFVYEFAVISRGYASGVLLALTVCALYARARPPLLVIAALLALLANTSAYGVILTIALAAGMTVDGRFEPGPRLAAAALIVAAGISIAILSIRLPPDVPFGREWHTTLDGRRIAYTLDAAWAAYVPLPDFRSASPWNSNFLFGEWIPSGRAPARGPAVLAVVLLAAIVVALWHQRGALTAYVVGAVMMCGLIFLKYSGGMRHHGHLFILLVVALWLGSRGAPGRRVQRARPWLVALLVPQVLTGAYFVVQDLREPFSVSKDLAQYVAGLPRSAAVVVAETGPLSYTGPVLSGYLRRPVYYALRHRVVRESFFTYNAEHYDPPSEAEMLLQLERFAAERGTDVFVVTENWESTQIGTLEAQFNRHLEIDEGAVAVYRYHRRNSHP